MTTVIKWIRDNALSLSMFALFAGCFFATTATGHHSYNEQQASQGYPPVGFWDYLGTGTFLDGVFVNWQAAALQLTALIIFSEFMSQRGASHSRKPEGEENGKSQQKAEKKEESASHKTADHGSGSHARDASDCRGRQQKETAGKSDQKNRGSWKDSWLYRNSLSIAFVLLFSASFAVHLVYGQHAANEERHLLHQPPIGILDFLISPGLWFKTFQTWQAEFFVMWFFLIGSIYLRQEYSSESKALGAADQDTGDPNE
jgi:hypothetical protein